MRGWRSYVEGAPNEVTSTCVTITFPANPELPEAIHDRPVIIVGGVYVGDVEAGLAEMQPLRELGNALFDMSGPTPYVGVQTGFDALFPRDTLRAYWKSQYLDELSDDAIDTIAAKAQDRPAPLTLMNTFAMGGAIADVGEEETAFATAHRRHTWCRSTACGPRRATTTRTSPGCGPRGTPSRSTGPVRSTSTSPAWRTRTHRPASTPRWDATSRGGGGQGEVRPGQLLPGEQQRGARR